MRRNFVLPIYTAYNFQGDPKDFFFVQGYFIPKKQIIIYSRKQARDIAQDIENLPPLVGLAIYELIPKECKSKYRDDLPSADVIEQALEKQRDLVIQAEQKE